MLKPRQIHFNYSCAQKPNIFLLLSLICCLGISPICLCAQESIPSSSFKIIHYGVEDGLSQGSVYAMLKDSRNFMWFTSLEGLNRFDGHDFKIYAQNEQDSTALRGTATFGLVEDPYGNMWTGTEVCLNRYRRLSDDFDFIYSEDEQGKPAPATHYPFYVDSTEVWYANSREGIVAFNFIKKEKRIVSDTFLYQGTSSIINSTLMGADGKIWIRNWQGLIRLDPSGGQFDYYFTDEVAEALGPPMAFTCHRPASDGTIWLGGNGELIHLDPRSEEWTSYPLDSSISISDIQEAPNALLYLGTNYSGLYLFRPGAGVLGHLDTQNTLLSGTSVPTIYIDDEGLVWVNTDPNGIDLLFPDFNGFQRYGELFFESLGLSSAGIRCFAESPSGDIWIGTNKDGVIIFDPVQKRLIRQISPFGADGLSENHASFIHFDKKGRIWAGTYYGLFFSEDGKDFRRVENGIPFSLNNPAHEFWDMKETPEGFLFVTTSAGLFYIPPGETRAYSVNGFEGLSLGDIEQYGDFLLVSEYIRGCSVFNYREWLNNGQSKARPSQFIDYLYVKHFAPEGDSLLWLATNKGVLKTKPSADFSEVEVLGRYTRNEGLPSDYIYGLLWDKTGKIWMSTNRGIAQLDPKTGLIKTYGLEDNIQGYEFNTNAYLRTSRGEFFFGGTKGFNQFNLPLDGNPSLPSVHLTGLDIEGQDGYDGSYIGELSRIKLKSWENTFELQFVATDYWSKGRNRYRVRLREYEQDWVDLEEGRIRYTQVPPGQYVFEVLATNGQGEWTKEPKRLQISIAPPWYRTIWAYLAYILIALFILYQIYQFRKRRRALQQKLLMEQLEAERLKELDEVKNRFFTNITHEFRTPLTVLLGLTDEIERDATVNLTQRLQLIRKNGKDLLELVNQLLDLARVDVGQLQIKMVKDDVIGFMRMLVDSFHSFALTQKTGLQFYSESDHFEMDFDPDLLQRILTNLLSNAFRFTPEYGKILVVAKVIEEKDKKQLEIKVKDNGEGIVPEKLPHVFDRFYASSPQHKKTNTQFMQQGAGIGLALVKELVELMDGHVKVKSQPGKGTTFIFTLPVSRQAATPEVPAYPDIQTAWISTGRQDAGWSSMIEHENDELPLALLIEDNVDVLYYLQTCLGEGWRIETCQNGQSGVDKAIELIPDVIVSDVMMPGMDGFEVVKTLKADERTSHIPILMLTAKATQADKLKGLATGADAYLIKPFDKKELLLRLDNFLQMRSRLQTHFQGAIQPNPTDPEQLFLEKINQIILRHLDESGFNTHHLAREAGLSRSQLYRKLKALTGQSLSRYMRSFRLKQAREMLQTTGLPVSEVAWMSGFESLSWFDQAYLEEFGESPSETRN